MKPVALLLASATLVLPLAAPPADAQPLGYCGIWPPGGRSTIDAFCTERESGRDCALWLYLLRDNLRETCAQMP